MSLTPADFDLIPDDEADPIFGNSKITRSRWRREAGGPPFIKIGRRVFYPRAKLADWIRGREAWSTAESKQKLCNQRDREVA